MVRSWGCRISCVVVLLLLSGLSLPAAAAAPARARATSLAHAVPAQSSAGPTVTLAAPSSPLRGTESFNASVTHNTGPTIVSVQFEYSPAGADSWTTFRASTAAPYKAVLFTPPLANGPYDFRAVATDSAGDTFTSSPATDLTTDLTVANSATYVALANPGTPVAGTVDLSARPESGGNAPDTVTFQICPTTADCPANPANWKTLSTVPPEQDVFGNPTGQYVTTLNTLNPSNSLADGSYDLAVSGEDASGDGFQGGVSPWHSP